jgi:hypothetical protein
LIEEYSNMDGISDITVPSGEGYVHDTCVQHSTRFRKAARSIVSFCRKYQTNV